MEKELNRTWIPKREEIRWGPGILEFLSSFPKTLPGKRASPELKKVKRHNDFQIGFQVKKLKRK